jgi:hypothetical protein
MRRTSLAIAAIALFGFVALAWAKTPIPTKLTIHVEIDGDNYHFSGKAKSDKAACEARRRVSLYENGPVPELVGTDRTDPQGNWQIDKVGGGDSYHAEVAKREKPNYACKADRSRDLGFGTTP